MRKRFYILFVTRDAEGELRKIPIPLHYLYVFLAGAVLGMSIITGMAGSYTRMLLKVARFNELRQEKDAIKVRYNALEEAAKEKDLQVASLGSIASEVSTLYGLKPDPRLSSTPVENSVHSLDDLYALKTAALSGAATIGIGAGVRNATLADWMRIASQPTLWPVQGTVTSGYGERVDPFNGEGAYHRGIDISTGYGTPVIAPADGEVVFAGFESGYGRLIVIDHGAGCQTRYGHLASFAISSGQTVHRGDLIGYVGLSGRSTGPHLHYEVWLHNAPVNPRKYLKLPATGFMFKAASM